MTKKNMTTKIAALIALIAIFGSIIWTWILIIYETYFSSNSTNKNNLTQEQLQEILKSSSWSLTSSWEINQ